MVTNGLFDTLSLSVCLAKIFRVVGHNKLIDSAFLFSLVRISCSLSPSITCIKKKRFNDWGSVARFVVILGIYALHIDAFDGWLDVNILMW